MEFKVMNREEARRFSFQSHDFSSMIISINSVGSPCNEFCYNPNYNKIKYILMETFDDVVSGEKNCMTSLQADTLTDFVNRHKDDVDCIIVHCDAGISRSAGVCAAIMKYLTNDDWAIFNSWKYCPNMTCYKLVLESFQYFVPKEEIQEKEKTNIAEWCRKNDI